MSENELLKRQQANQQIEHFLMQHSLHAYRRCSKKHFEDAAITLQYYLSILHKGDRSTIIQKLRAVADTIAAYDLNDYMVADGHHERAAKPIRSLADKLEADSCPWGSLLPLLANKKTLRSLATCLWKHNRNHANAWDVRLDIVTDEVWGDSSTSRTTIRSAVTRLVEWLRNEGIHVEFSVSYQAEPPCIRCKIILVDVNQNAAIL